MEVFSFETIFLQILSHLFSSSTSIAIYDSGLVRVIFLDKLNDVVFYVSFLGNNGVS